MNNRLTGLAVAARTLAGQPAAWLSASRISARGLLSTAHHTMSIFGITALVMIGVLFFRPDLAVSLSKALAGEAEPVAPAIVAPPLSELMEAPASVKPAALLAKEEPLSHDEKALMGTRKQQEFVTTWLSKRYRVASDATNMLVSTAYLTAREIKLDPLLILAVMAIESGLNPFAESPMGAQGLMQVMSKVHTEKFQELGGVQAALNPVANIRVGALILKDYVARGGSVEAGLKSYVGAGAFETDDGYGVRVMAEYNRLKQVSAGKKVPTITPVMAAATPKPQPQPQAVAPTAVAVNDKVTPEQLAGL
jgi:hypothetical protein